MIVRIHVHVDAAFAFIFLKVISSEIVVFRSALISVSRVLIFLSVGMWSCNICDS